LQKGGNNDKSKHRGFFSSHEIIDSYYSLYVNFYGRMDRNKVKL